VDRRFVTFLVLTFLIWTAFLLGRTLLLPPKPPADKNAAAKVDPKDPEKKAQPGDDPAGKANDPNPEPKPEPGPEPNPKEAVPAVAAPAVARKSIMFGSLDPASPYSMLVTADSHGAAIERVELNDPRYKAVNDESGYLGHLGFAMIGRETKDSIIQTIGAGTPAALATPLDSAKPKGLAIGDVVRQVNETPIERGEELELWLRKNTRFGQQVEITVDRTTGGKTESLKYRATLTRRPLEIIQPESRTTVAKTQVTDPLSFLLTFETLQGQVVKQNEDEIRLLPSLHERNWEIEEASEDSVTFTTTLNDAALKKINRTGSLKVIKKFTLPKAAEGDPTTSKTKTYHLNLEVGIENTSEEAVSLQYRLNGPNGIPLEGWWYSTKLHRDMFKGAGARDVVFQLGNEPHHLIGAPMIYDHAKKALKGNTLIEHSIVDQSTARPLTYAGIDAQFFAAVVLPQGSGAIPGKNPIQFSRVVAVPMHDVNQLTKTRIRTTNTSVRFVSTRENVEPGKSLTHHYQVFLGPKEPTILKDYALDELIEYGWPYAAYPARWLSWLLGALYGITGNYGVAIILLTVLVRMCMLPFSIRQARAAKLMQEISTKLKPEITALKEKYKDDPLKQHQATQELMKKHGMPNPFAGCLLVFFQLPVFVGLYRCLSVDIHLRDASLFPGWSWVSNLAGPDKLFYWKDMMPAFIADEADGWLGPFFNVFPLITIVLFIIQQKLFTPPPTDEQQEMQQQMMMWMSLFMGVMFYKVPAGLCLYFITSSLWSIAERTLLPKSKPIDPKDQTLVEKNPPPERAISARTARRQKKR
jgi:YidC/Oxa1 family membrane protein insertase